MFYAIHGAAFRDGGSREVALVLPHWSSRPGAPATASRGRSSQPPVRLAWQAVAAGGDARVVEAIVPRADAGDRYLRRGSRQEAAGAGGYGVVAEAIASCEPAPETKRSRSVRQRWRPDVAASRSDGVELRTRLNARCLQAMARP
jgi:hypothetical protein